MNMKSVNKNKDNPILLCSHNRINSGPMGVGVSLTDLDFKSLLNCRTLRKL
jgi:hypothetical protein